jgi:putative nucleotidyltransferase with HDIG domain
MDRNKALRLLQEYTSNKNLIKHMLAVEVTMRAYAKKFNEDENWWGIVGLLHDFDYEKYPTPKDHPYKGAEILKKEGYPDEFIKTILAHASHTNEPRDTLAKKAIYAVDELTGLIVATALVKPNKSLVEVDVKSVRKKMKDKAFARQINRQEIIQGAEELGVSIDEHIDTVLRSMQTISKELNL